MTDIISNLSCVGIMGGTFNPVHNGHVLMAKTAYEQFDEIDKIVFMPNNIPNYKDSNDIVATEHRISMLSLAIGEYPWAIISDMEIKRGGITYTYDTLCELLEINPKLKIYFIIGSDSLNSFRKWYRYRDILSMCTLLVASRNNEEDSVRYVGEKLLKDCGVGSIEYLIMDEYDAASSDIRNKIKSGIIPADILPAGIPEYIQENKLYR